MGWLLWLGLSAEVLAVPVGIGQNEFFEQQNEQLRLTLMQLQDQNARLLDRQQKLETELGFLQQKLDAYRLEAEARDAKGKKKANHVALSDLDRQLASVGGAGFSLLVDLRQNANWADYQNGVLLFKAERFADARLAFSTFLAKAADQFLAGHAYFYLGSCFFAEKKFADAIEQLEKVVAIYDKSPMIPQSFLLLVQSWTNLGKKEQADKIEFYLTTVFRLSPEAVALTKINSQGEG
jgi:TolA-binding protein